MSTGEDKRARIIRQQAEREAAERAATNASPPPKPRQNWAASPPRGFARRGMRPAGAPGKPGPR